MIRDKMTTKFIQLSSKESAATARAVLTNNPEHLVVILDEDRQRFNLLAANDLNRLRRETGTLAEFFGDYWLIMTSQPHVRLGELKASTEFAALETGDRSVLVYDGDKVVGVLTEEEIERYRDEPSGPTKGLLASDTRLAGGFKVPLIEKQGKKLYYHNRHK